jgi:hypothetical protein
MKKAIYVIFLLLCASWCLQCSNSPDDGYQAIDKNPKLDQKQFLYENGRLGNYSTVFNARMTINSIDSVRGDSISSVSLKNAFLGIDVPSYFENTTATTKVYIDSLSNDLYIFVNRPDYFSVLGHSDPKKNDYGSWIELKYETWNSGDISIFGKGQGAYLDCGVVEYDWEDSGFVFTFNGLYNDSSNAFEGRFLWQQISSDGTCDINCSGTMAMLLD